MDGISNGGDKKALLHLSIHDYSLMLYYMGVMKTPMITVINGIASQYHDLILFLKY
jgi:hypothetical protein